jgi:hypothetical protein
MPSNGAAIQAPTFLDAGFSWLAESRHMTFSLAFYDPERVLRNANFTLRGRNCSLLVKNLTSAKTVTRIMGATRPTCGAQ